jgi:hypothetical protein
MSIYIIFWVFVCPVAVVLLGGKGVRVSTGTYIITVYMDV